MFEKSAPTCPSTLCPTFRRYIRSKLRFKEEVDVRIISVLMFRFLPESKKSPLYPIVTSKVIDISGKIKCKKNLLCPYFDLQQCLI